MHHTELSTHDIGQGCVLCIGQARSLFMDISISLTFKKDIKRMCLTQTSKVWLKISSPPLPARNRGLIDGKFHNWNLDRKALWSIVWNQDWQVKNRKIKSGAYSWVATKTRHTTLFLIFHKLWSYLSTPPASVLMQPFPSRFCAIFSPSSLAAAEQAWSHSSSLPE